MWGIIHGCSYASNIAYVLLSSEKSNERRSALNKHIEQSAQIAVCQQSHFCTSRYRRLVCMMFVPYLLMKRIFLGRRRNNQFLIILFAFLSGLHHTQAGILSSEFKYFISNISFYAVIRWKLVSTIHLIRQILFVYSLIAHRSAFIVDLKKMFVNVYFVQNSIPTNCLCNAFLFVSAWCTRVAPSTQHTTTQPCEEARKIKLNKKKKREKTILAGQ